MNSQNREEKFSSDEGKLQVHSIFRTIQGEGPFVGVPATFIRLAGCNLQCPQCDTDYTEGRRELSPWAIVEEVKLLEEGRNLRAHMAGGPLVVITGGEPFRQASLGSLVNALLATDYRVQIETNGTMYTPGPWNSTTIVCSPKTTKLHPQLVPYISAFKYVVDAWNVMPDGLPSSVLGFGLIPARPPLTFKGPVYVQPMDSDSLENKNHVATAIRSCQDHGYTLCLQIHKILELP